MKLRKIENNGPTINRYFCVVLVGAQYLDLSLYCILQSTKLISFEYIPLHELFFCYFKVFRY